MQSADNKSINRGPHIPMTYNFLLPNLGAGGAERISLLLARVLVKNGVEVRFVNLGSPKGEIRGWIQPEFELVSLGCRRSLTAIPALVKYLRKHRCEGVFASRENASIAGLIACGISGHPIIIRLPNMPTNQLLHGIKGIKLKIVKWVTRRVYKRARYVITQTEEMRQQTISYYKLPPEKVVTIYNPLDEEAVKRQAQTSEDPYTHAGPRFLFVGTIAYRKGVDILLEAFSTVKRDIPDATLTILGGKDGNYASNLVEKWEGMEGIEFKGFVENPYPYMAHCDVFVLPSRMEGLPNVLLEAMSLNKPVAATTCLPIVSQLVKEGVNGYLCPVENTELLSKAMIKALTLKDIQNRYELFDSKKLLEVFQKNN